MGQEVASLGVQVYGGHGYIREWGMEQLMRDSRITQLYEGTNGIQALDYIRRKLLGDGGAELSALQAEFSEICDRQIDRPALHALASKVQMRLGEWRELTAEIIAATGRDPQEIGAVSVDFLQYSAYVLLAGLWLRRVHRMRWSRAPVRRLSIRPSWPVRISICAVCYRGRVRIGKPFRVARIV